MSRYCIPSYCYEPVLDDSVESGTIAYGFDHAVGYFFQVLDEQDEPMIDADSTFDGLSGMVLAQTLLHMRQDGFNIPAAHIIRAAHDLPL